MVAMVMVLELVMGLLMQFLETKPFKLGNSHTSLGRSFGIASRGHDGETKKMLNNCKALEKR